MTSDSFFADFPEHLHAQAETITIAAGETLFQEGDEAKYLYMRKSGYCMLSQNAEPVGEATNEFLDEVAVLGGLPQTQRAIAITECEFVRWKIDDLWLDETFRKNARQYLAHHLVQSQNKLEQLQATVHYQPYTSQVQAGPYVFPNSTIIFAFCSAPNLKLSLPDGVSRIGNGVLLGIAEFRDAYYHHKPSARFSYSETTVFVPVRVGVKLGLYVPYIYPSSYEPIVLGREIYGFPKQFGETLIAENSAGLSVSKQDYFHLRWTKTESSNEPRIVGAFGQLFGVQGHLTAAAFAIGDTLLGLINVPFYRRVNVFNHKRFPSVATTHDNPTYDIDMLTQAIFSVENWQKINYLPDAKLSPYNIMKDWNLSLRESFYTDLSMRLSTGRIQRNYLERK